MIRHVSRFAALAGLVIALFVVWRSHPAEVLGLLRDAGAGLLVAGLAHVLPMLANARDWQTLIRGANRPTLLSMLKLVWIRESVNCMLPVARVGGELVSFQLLRRWRVRASTAAASLVVDMQLTIISQFVFTMAGIGFLAARGDSATGHVVGGLAWSTALLVPVPILFALVQHANPFALVSRGLDRMTSGKLTALVGHSVKTDQSIKVIWRRRAVVLRYLFFWQPLQCLATALEIWLALYFLGANVSFLAALTIEVLIQAVSSAAFVVPGALGIQEGAFVLIGGWLGIEPATSLALAGARRIRDLLIFIPGLFAWQFSLRNAR
ncbi:lysylphosphatidylglycerol synthase domain-containing protein [Paraburkholderia diazotrophica]|uniref:Putative membrane protein n=1 Tax=Paraburkholderia diazotrophica TaxID=667676 RepID=A0A1H7BUZ2_9BURK|nr:lysylphosphatidylglycerol synthase domain-containing protein [Paraburkholderia diazotrophica]SEJ81483.1 putative membrane protein [Paraburkholderia diazotrophica]